MSAAPNNGRRADTNRLSAIVVAVVVLGTIGAAGAVGATVGAASTRRVVPDVAISIPPSTDDLDVVAVDRSPQPLGISALTPITRPTGSSTTIAGSLVTLAPRARPGASTTLAAGGTATTLAAAGISTSTSVTPSSVTPTTASAIGGASSTLAPTSTVLVTTTLAGLIPRNVTATTLPSATTTLPLQTTTLPIVIGSLPATQTTTTTTTPRRPSTAYKLPGGLLFEPASGYDVIDRYSNGMTVTNGVALVDVWGVADSQTTASSAALYAVQNVVTDRFDGVEFGDVQSLNPTKRTVLQFASIPFRGTISGESGSTPIEGIVYTALRQDGLMLVFEVAWIDGEFDNVKGDLGAMFGSVLANM